MTDRPATAAEAMRNCDALLLPQIYRVAQKSKLLYCDNSLLFLSHPVYPAAAVPDPASDVSHRRALVLHAAAAEVLSEEHDGSVAPEWSGSDEHQP